MTPADFRRIVLSLDGVEEYDQAGLPAFRVGGARFASLASQADGYGNLHLTLEQQAAFVEEAPEVFLPIPGGFGRMSHTHIRLAAANEDVLTGALRTSWKLRVDTNAKQRRKNRSSPASGGSKKSPESCKPVQPRQRLLQKMLSVFIRQDELCRSRRSFALTRIGSY